MTQPFSAALCVDSEIEAFFTPEAEFSAMLKFEEALAKAQASSGLIPVEAAVAIARACQQFPQNTEALTARLIKDGVLGPGFIESLRKTLPQAIQKYLHFGATSQDVTDTALTLRLKPCLAVLDARLVVLIDALEALCRHQGDIRLMAQTRMQAALPITVRDKVTSWLLPLRRHRERLAGLAPRLLVIQLGGPVGTRAELGENAEIIAAELAGCLGLGNAPCWHTARDTLIELGATLALIVGTLGKIGQDVALLAQSENGALKVTGGGASSAMAHKVNPVAAEVLVALARYAGGLAGTLNQAMIHENERSGAAWTLEWFVLPPLAMAAGKALGRAAELVSHMQFQLVGGGQQEQD